MLKTEFCTGHMASSGLWYTVRHATSHSPIARGGDLGCADGTGAGSFCRHVAADAADRHNAPIADGTRPHDAGYVIRRSNCRRFTHCAVYGNAYTRHCFRRPYSIHGAMAVGTLGHHGIDRACIITLVRVAQRGARNGPAPGRVGESAPGNSQVGAGTGSKRRQPKILGRRTHAGQVVRSMIGRFAGVRRCGGARRRRRLRRARRGPIWTESNSHSCAQSFRTKRPAQQSRDWSALL